MNIQWLSSSITTAECGSFTQAAELLYTSQSTVSKHVLALERELGITLFDRSRRNPILTAEGEAVLEQGKIVIKQYESMISIISNIRKDQLNIVSIPVMTQDYTKCASRYAKRPVSSQMSAIPAQGWKISRG